MAATPDELKRKVAYFYKPSIGDYSYGDNHFMKPERIRLTDNYVQKHNLYKGMEIVKDYSVAEEKDILKFHSKDYVDFLKSVAPSLIMKEEDKNKFGIDADCPAFDGVYAFSQLSAGGSIAAASFLNNQRADIAINWSGGLHHAKMTRASGFCFVNDIVLGILELLKFYPRVLYVDIDMHHGDGVEEAFYCTNRVMTVSFHKYGEGFFPESGHYEDIGHDSGRGYSLNVPLHSGIDDDSFVALFQPVMQKVMDVYQPNAVVLQCGADSLIGDPIGKFNLSIKGHAYCLKFFRAFNVPLLILGGGGYMPENVAKCWCYETSLAAGIDIDIDDPSLSLAFEKRNPNKNHEKDLNDMRELLIDRVSKLSYAPSVQFMDVDVSLTKVPEEGEVPMDTRPKARISMPKDDEE